MAWPTHPEPGWPPLIGQVGYEADQANQRRRLARSQTRHANRLLPVAKDHQKQHRQAKKAAKRKSGRPGARRTDEHEEDDDDSDGSDPCPSKRLSLPTLPVEVYWVDLPFDNETQPEDPHRMSRTHMSILRHEDQVNTPSRIVFIKHFVGRVNREMQHRGQEPFQSVLAVLRDLGKTQERSRVYIGFTADQYARVQRQCGDSWKGRMAMFYSKGLPTGTDAAWISPPEPICVRALCGHTQGPPSDDETYDTRFLNRESQKLSWSRILLKHVGHPLAKGNIAILYHFYEDNGEERTSWSFAECGLLRGGPQGDGKSAVYMSAAAPDQWSAEWTPEELEKEIRRQVFI